MSYDVVLTDSLRQSVRQLRKRYRHVKDDLMVAARTLVENPDLGALLTGGHGVRKLRVRSSDLSRGKSGGFRLLHSLSDSPRKTIYLLLLYAKTDQEDVSAAELRQLLRELEEGP